MAIQLSAAVRNARLDAVEVTIGVSAVLKIRSGAPPADVATADSGTVLATMTLPSDWMAAAASGAKALLGTWQDTSADNTGTAGHFRIYASDGTTKHLQGTITLSDPLVTSALTAAGSNVLTFPATTGVVAGMGVSGAGVPAGATVLSTTGTTVTLSMVSTAGVASGVTITFAGDMTLDNTSIASGQSVSVTSFTLTDGNA